MPEDLESHIKPSQVQIEVTRLGGEHPIFELQCALRSLAEKLEFWASREVVWQQSAPLPIDISGGSIMADIRLKVRKGG